MAEEEPLARLILEILRRKRKASLWDIVLEIYREPRPSDVERIRNIMRRLEVTGAVIRHVEPVRGPIVRYIWYDARLLRRLIVRRPGQRLTDTEIARYVGIPKEEVERILRFAIERGWLRPTEVAGVFQVPERIYRVQKMRAWRTGKRESNYQVEFDGKISIPRQLVLDGFASSILTDRMDIGVHGACRIVVYTLAPDRWPEDRLERIMRGLFAQEGITLEIFSDLPYIKTGQAYEVEEIDIDEKPKEIGVDEPDLWLWVAKEEGYTFAYHYIRRPWGWTYERYIVR